MTKKKSKSKKGRVIGKPRDWNRCLEVAGLRLQGATQEEAAEIAGCSIRSVRLWERSEWWPDVKDAANDKWGDAVLAFSRRAILAAVREGEVATAKWVLTNMDERFLKKKEEVDLNLIYTLEMPELEDFADEEE